LFLVDAENAAGEVLDEGGHLNSIKSIDGEVGTGIGNQRG
jgi:hypothetical protein